MTLKEKLDRFYEELKVFLLDSGVEKPDMLSGFNDVEISLVEAAYKLKFPYAYFLFLKYFGKGNPLFFDNHSYSIEKLSNAHETSIKIRKSNNIKIENEIFVFSQWQEYSFTYLETGKDNPPVTMITEGDSLSDPPEVKNEECFTDWLCNLIITNLKFRHQIDGLPVYSKLDRLNEIGNIHSH